MDGSYTVTGMTCEHCVAAVRAEVGSVDGVQDVTVDLATGALAVHGVRFDDAEIAAAVDEAGYAIT